MQSIQHPGSSKDGEIAKDLNLHHKTILITGANTGIGYEAAVDFVRRGAHIIMACRNLERAEEAKSKVNFKNFNIGFLYNQNMVLFLKSIIYLNEPNFNLSVPS